jgi:hypothetical protein
MTARPLPTDIGAERLIELFYAAATTKAYGAALSLIADSGRFTDAERGDLARAMARCWAKVAQL